MIRQLTKGKGKTYLGIAAGVLAVGAGTTWAIRLGRITKEVVIITHSDFDKTNLQYIVHVSIKNPVSQGIRVKSPFVRLNYQDKVIASSQPSNQVLTIPANGTSDTTLRIAFDRDKLLAAAPSVATTLLAGGKISLTATTLSGLVTMLGTTEFSKSETWKLGW